MIFQFTAALYCHPFQRSYNQPRTFTRFQKYIIVKFIFKSKYNRWKYSFFRSNEFIVILSRDKRQGNRATEERGKKKVSSFLARITRIRETLSLFCKLKKPFQKETCSNREKFERESDRRRSIERFDTVYGNKFQSRTCVSRTRANWSGSGAVPTRRTRESLSRVEVGDAETGVACTRSRFMERCVIDFHYDANCPGHDTTQNNCLILLTRNLVPIFLSSFFFFYNFLLFSSAFLRSSAQRSGAIRRYNLGELLYIILEGNYSELLELYKFVFREKFEKSYELY